MRETEGTKQWEAGELEKCWAAGWEGNSSDKESCKSSAVTNHRIPTAEAATSLCSYSSPCRKVPPSHSDVVSAGCWDSLHCML
eukprot:scaffold185014_cov14-Tisochrysis_lutea.AAC.1